MRPLEELIQMFRTPVDECLILVTQKDHKRFGQVGRLRDHAWNEDGSMMVDFLDGKSEKFWDRGDEYSRERYIEMENMHYTKFIDRIRELTSRPDAELFYASLSRRNERFGQVGVVYPRTYCVGNTTFYETTFNVAYLDKVVEYSTFLHERNPMMPGIIGDEEKFVRLLYELTPLDLKEVLKDNNEAKYLMEKR